MKNILLLLLFQISLLAGQNIKENNTVYLEAFGVGGWYSINYERLIDDSFSIRIGFTTWSSSSTDLIYYGTGPYTAVPIMGNYLLGLGDGGSKLDLGIGIDCIKTNHISHWQTTGIGIIGASTICYRYQPYSGGMVFRIGVSQLFNSSDFINMAGISIGYCF